METREGEPLHHPDGAVDDGFLTLTAAKGYVSYQTMAQLDVDQNEITALGTFTIFGGTGLPTRAAAARSAPPERSLRRSSSRAG